MRGGLRGKRVEGVVCVEMGGVNEGGRGVHCIAMAFENCWIRDLAIECCDDFTYENWRREEKRRTKGSGRCGEEITSRVRGRQVVTT